MNNGTALRFYPPVDVQANFLMRQMRSLRPSNIVSDEQIVANIAVGTKASQKILGL